MEQRGCTQQDWRGEEMQRGVETGKVVDMGGKEETAEGHEVEEPGSRIGRYAQHVPQQHHGGRHYPSD